jgi:hypothetical protein
MTRKTIPGAFTKDAVNPKYNKDYNTKRYKESKNKYFPTGAYSLTDDLMSAVNDNDYIILIPIRFGDSQYIGNLATTAYKLGMTTGNLKDENSTESAAFETLCEEWIDVLFNLGPQQIILDLMDNPIRADTVLDLNDGDADVVVPLFAEDARNTLISELEGMLIPKFSLEIWKAFNFYFKTRESWVKGGIGHPGSYLIPITPYSALTTVQASKEAIYSNQGYSKNHMDKFGIKYTKFSRDMLAGEEHDISNGVLDNTAIGFFGEWFLPITDDGDPGTGTTLLQARYPLHLDGSESHRLYFPTGSKPDDIPLYSVLPLMHTYNATYNPYGGLLAGSWSSTVNDMVLRAAKGQSTLFTACNVVSTEVWGGALLPLFGCINGGHTVANFTMSYTGDYLSQDFDGTIGHWPEGNKRGYKVWSGYSETNWKAMIQKKAIEMMF